MDDAIVAQVEWYLGRVNLLSDIYLKSHMDADLWVDLLVILAFPKMIRLGVTDPRLVADLLSARSTIVEVHPSSTRIRPAWARRSTLVLSNLSPQTRPDDLLALLASSPTDPPGLVSLHPAGDAAWFAVYDTPTGAAAALPLVQGSTLHGSKIHADVHGDPMIRGPADLQAHLRTPEPLAYPPPTFISPMGMPLPLPHDPASPYLPPTYAQGYPAQSLPVTRPFISTRPHLAQNYLVAYPQPPNPYDPAAMPVPPQSQQIAHAPLAQSSSHQQSHSPSVEQSSQPAAAQTLADARVSDSTPSQPQIPCTDGDKSSMPAENGVEPADSSSATDSSAVAPDTLPEPHFAASHMQGMLPRQLESPHLVAVPMGDGKGTVDPFMARGLLPDHARMIGGYARPMGPRGRVPPPPRMRPGPGVDIAARGPVSRKGKKGNRGNNGRPPNGDRHDGRQFDAKGDGVHSPVGMEDRRGSKEDRAKPEPNLNAMHFPPLPIANDGLATRSAQPVNDGNNLEGEAESRNDANDVEPASSLSAGVGDAADASEKLEGGPQSKRPEMSGSEIGATEPTDSVMGAVMSKNSAGCHDVKNPAKDFISGGAKSDIGVDVQGRDPGISAASERKVFEQRNISTGGLNGSTLSYAAILRSKKPALPIQRSSNPLQRGVSDSSSRSGDTNGNAEMTSAGRLASKDRMARRKKSNLGQSGPHVGNREMGKAVVDEAPPFVGPNGAKAGAKSSSSMVPSANGSVKEPSLNDPGKAKALRDAPRAHSVWANKPRSVFQAASAVPAGRYSASTASSADVKRFGAPSAQQTEEHTTDKRPFDRPVRSAVGNGQVESGDDQMGKATDSASSGSDIPDLHQLSLEKVGSNTASISMNSPVDSLGARLERSEQGSTHGNQAPKGAWASGGPKAWPKNNGSGNGLMDRSSSISES